MTLLWLLLFPLFVWLGLNLLLLPLHFTVQSIFSLIVIPQEIYRIATNKRLRVNHALEHATINVIEEHLGVRGRLAGLAYPDGFLIRGVDDPYLLAEAARVGLERLRRGEYHLAIHDRCGTSLAAANWLFSVLFLLVLFGAGYFSFTAILLALVAAQLLGPWLGRWLQRTLTTSVDVAGVEILGVTAQRRQTLISWVFGFEPGLYFVRTGYRRLVPIW